MFTVRAASAGAPAREARPRLRAAHRALACRSAGQRAGQTPSHGGADAAGLEQRGDIDKTTHQGEVLRGSAKPIAGGRVGAFPQQPLDDAAEAVQGGKVQGGQAAVVDMVERNAFVEQALEHSEQKFLIDARTRLGTRAEQQQRGRLLGVVPCVGIGVGQQQSIDKRDHPGRLARSEREERGAMERRQPLGVAGIDRRTGTQQTRDQIGQAQGGSQHERGHRTGHRLFRVGPGSQQAVDHGGMAHADGRRERGGAGTCGQPDAGVQAQEVVNQGDMPPSGRAQQGGAALGVGAIQGQTQGNQAHHGPQVTSHRGGRQVAGAQGSTGQLPWPPIQPLGQVPAAAGTGAGTSVTLS